MVAAARPASPDAPPPEPPLPPHGRKIRSWHQRQRGGTRQDRMLDQVETRVPPLLADREIPLTSAQVVLGERTLQAISRTDALAGPDAQALARFMTRIESIASSRIEHIEVEMDDLARAIAGSRARAAALSMVAAARALQSLQLEVGARGHIDLEDLLTAHRLLMEEDENPGDRAFAGILRTDQNWIGGSQHAPREALYVPPPPDLVLGLLEDLLAFVARDDVPVLWQAVIAHAQFESIHPFTDGNGRIGRALIGAILQRRGVTRHAAVPLAAGLLALREEYFAGLDRYREGDPGALYDVLARAMEAAAEEALVAIENLRSLPSAWQAEMGADRTTAIARLLTAMSAHPTLTIEEIAVLADVGTSRAYEIVTRLETAGIIREVTGRRRDRIWAVTDVVGEIEELERRVRSRFGSAAGAS